MEDIQNSLKTVFSGLQALKTEHSTVQTNLTDSIKGVAAADAVLPREKIEIVNVNATKVDGGMDDINMMRAIIQYQQATKAEKVELSSQNRLLTQENYWLRDELEKCQKTIVDLTKKHSEMEEEIGQLKFFNTIDQESDEVRKTNTVDAAPLPVSNETLQDLGFGPEEEDYMNGSAYSSPPRESVPSNASSYDIPPRIRVLQTMVMKCSAEGRYDVAIPICKKTLEELRKELGADHLDIATLLDIFSVLYRNQGKLKDALVLLNEALAIREKKLDSNDPLIASTLNNLSILYGKREKYADAEPLCKRALEIRQKNLGDDHPDVAKQLNNLALVCQHLHKYAEVEEYYKKSIDIYERKFGSTDPNVTRSKNFLAAAYLKQQKYVEAENIYKEILTKAHEKDHGKAGDKPIWKVAEEREENKHQGAPHEENPLKRSTKIDSQVATTLKNLSSIYRRQGKYEAAETLEDIVLRAKKQQSSYKDSMLASQSNGSTSHLQKK